MLAVAEIVAAEVPGRRRPAKEARTRPSAAGRLSRRRAVGAVVDGSRRAETLPLIALEAKGPEDKAAAPRAAPFCAGRSSHRGPSARVSSSVATAVGVDSRAIAPPAPVADVSSAAGVARPALLGQSVRGDSGAAEPRLARERRAAAAALAARFRRRRRERPLGNTCAGRGARRHARARRRRTAVSGEPKWARRAWKRAPTAGRRLGPADVSAGTAAARRLPASPASLGGADRDRWERKSPAPTAEARGWNRTPEQPMPGGRDAEERADGRRRIGGARPDQSCADNTAPIARDTRAIAEYSTPTISQNARTSNSSCAAIFRESSASDAVLPRFAMTVSNWAAWSKTASARVSR